MPISRVRSVTVASMMFMIPMPPTSSEIAAIRPMKRMNISRVVRACSSSSSGTVIRDIATSGGASSRVFLTRSAVSSTFLTSSTRSVTWLSSTISPSNEPLRRVTMKSPMRLQSVLMGM